MNSKSILMGAGTALAVILVVLGAFLNAIHAEAVRTAGTVRHGFPGGSGPDARG